MSSYKIPFNTSEFQKSNIHILFDHIKHVQKHEKKKNDISSRDDEEEVYNHPNDIILKYIRSDSITPETVVREILEVMPTVSHIQDKNGRVPLTLAIIHNAPESIIFNLAEVYHDGLTIPDRNGRTPMHYAFLAKRSNEIVNKLLLLSPKAALPIPNNVIKLMKFFTGQLKEDCKSFHPKLYVFISSTFTDTHTERNILKDNILPYLRRRGLQNGIEVAFVDMRWGIPDENTAHHLTWIACQRELKVCKQESSGMFFLSLQADKYGYTPLPRVLSKDIIDSCFTILTHEHDTNNIKKNNNHQTIVPAAVKHNNKTNVNHHPPIHHNKNHHTTTTTTTTHAVNNNKTHAVTPSELAIEWYLPDLNSIESSYFLKDLSTNGNNDNYYSTVLPTLLSNLADKSFDNSNPSLLINHSITEWEMLYATIGEDINRCFWLNRTFKGGIDRSIDPKKLFDDDNPSKLENLKLIMKNHFETSKRMLTYDEISFQAYLAYAHIEKSFDDVKKGKNLIEKGHNNHSGDEYDILIKEATNYFSKWQNDVTNLFDSELNKIIKINSNWKVNGNGVGLRGDIIDEILHHYEWANEKATSFMGRNDLINEALLLYAERKANDKSRINSLQGITFCVIGKSGSGKTCLMSKLVEILGNETTQELPVIFRACGTSSGSMTGHALILSIIMQMEYMFGETIHDKNFDEKIYKSCVSHLHYLLNKFSVILLIDSLDQLSDKDSERSFISFLEDVRPHVNTKIVVSALPDEDKYCYGCDMRLSALNVPRLVVTELKPRRKVVADSNAPPGGRDLQHEELLEREGRTLSPIQYQLMNDTFASAGANCTTLFVQLVVRLVKEWHSYSPVKNIIADSVKGLILNVFEVIESEYGSTLVQSVFGFITFAANGISDTEMEDLLSLHDEVMLSINKYNLSLRLPSHVWHRVRSALKGLICSRGGRFTWYHRQLQEISEELFQERKKSDKKNNDKLKITQIMASYFANLGGKTKKILEKNLSSQELILNEGGSIWFPGSIVNQRRCEEAPVHLIQSEMFDEAVNFMCNIEFICASARCGLVFTLIEHFRTLISHYGDRHDSSQYQKLMHYKRFLSQNVYSIDMYNPSNIVVISSRQPIVSEVRKDFLKIMKHSTGIQPVPIYSKTESDSPIWDRCMFLHRTEEFSKELNILEGHSLSVNAICVSHTDGFLVYSASSDSSVQVWSTETGANRVKMKGHTNKVNCLTLSPNGEVLVSAGAEICVWNVNTGLLLQTIRRKSNEIKDIDFSSSGNRLVSCGLSEICLWDSKDLKNVILEIILFGHSGGIQSVRFSPIDESIIAAGTWTSKVLLWDLSDNSSLIDFTVAKEKVITDDNVTAAEAEANKMYEVIKEKGYTTVGSLENVHFDWVTSIAFSPCGLFLASAGNDCRVVVWELQSRSAIHNLHGHSDRVLAVNYSSDSRLIVSGSKDSTVVIWDAVSGEQLSKFNGHTDGITSVCFTPNNKKILSASQDCSIRVWEVKSENILHHEPEIVHSLKITFCEYSPDGCFILTGSESDNCINKWDMNTCVFDTKYVGHEAQVNSAHFNSTGNQFVTSSNDKTIIIWDFIKKDIFKMIKLHHDFVTCARFSRDDSFIVSGSEDKTVAVWYPFNTQSYHESDDNNKKYHILTGHYNSVFSVDVDKSGHYIIAGFKDGFIRIWSTETYELINQQKVNSAAITCVRFSSYEKYIITTTDDGNITSWKLDFGKKLHREHSYSEHVDAVNYISFTKDGKSFVTCSVLQF